MSNEQRHRPTTDQLLECYERMLVIRFFEEALSDLFARNQLGGTSHFCIGQEACAVGVVSAVRETDWLVSNHRGHGHLLARNLDPARVMGELMGKLNGYCGGRGGSQHMCAMDRHFLGTNGITGGGLPIGTGAALALKCRRLDDIVVVFFGDGASNQGTFHESLNMASLWGLPVLFVCENNGYGMSNPVDRSTAADTIAGRAAAYRMRGEIADGMDLAEVFETTAWMAEEVRAGKGPALLELTTYRFCGHSKNDPRVYRTRDEESEWELRDCIERARLRLQRLGVEDAVLDSARSRARDCIDHAIAAATSAPYGNRDHALGGVYA